MPSWNIESLLIECLNSVSGRSPKERRYSMHPRHPRICHKKAVSTLRQGNAALDSRSRNSRPGRKAAKYRVYTALSEGSGQSGSEKGCTILSFRFASAQEPLPLPGATAFGDDVIRTVVQSSCRSHRPCARPWRMSGLLQMHHF